MLKATLERRQFTKTLETRTTETTRWHVWSYRLSKHAANSSIFGTPREAIFGNYPLIETTPLQRFETRGLLSRAMLDLFLATFSRFCFTCLAMRTCLFKPRLWGNRGGGIRIASLRFTDDLNPFAHCSHLPQVKPLSSRQWTCTCTGAHGRNVQSG